MKIFPLIGLFILSGIAMSAQVTDTARQPKRSFESSMFADDDTLTRNDYLQGISKVFQMLNKASSLSQPVPAIMLMAQRMDEDDSAISIIKDRYTNNDRALNVRSLQTFNIILSLIKVIPKYMLKNSIDTTAFLMPLKKKSLT